MQKNKATVIFVHYKLCQSNLMPVLKCYVLYVLIMKGLLRAFVTSWSFSVVKYLYYFDCAKKESLVCPRFSELIEGEKFALAKVM